MEVGNVWLQLLNNQKGKAYELLESIYQDMYKRIEFLEKENETLKSGAIYKQLTKENIDRINFSILEKNGNYYITISQRGVLGGVGNFVLNCKTLEIIEKTYEE